MDTDESLRRFLERALAFAHAALDNPTEDHVEQAMTMADEVLPRIERMRRLELTLGEARQIEQLVKQLRAVLAAVERRRVHAKAS